jgi:hypothetical protein
MRAHRTDADGRDKRSVRAPARIASAMVVRFLDHLEVLPFRDWRRALDVQRRAEARGASIVDAFAAAGRAERDSGLEQNVVAAQESVRRICASVNWLDAEPPFTERDRQTIELLAEWAAQAIVVRGIVTERAFRALYAPFAGVIPIATLEAARRPSLAVSGKAGKAGTRKPVRRPRDDERRA